MMLVAAFLIAASQELAIPPAHYPVPPATASNAATFVPPGWTIEQEATGDLNRDGKPDLALVLKENAAANILANNGLGPDRIDTNPRILLVAVRDGDIYRLAKANHSLVPRHLEPTLSDPFEEGGIAIKRGALAVSLHYFANAGGWDAGPSQFTFRLVGGDLKLIGFDRFNVKRNTMDETSLSVNFLTRRAVARHVPGDENSRAATKQYRLVSQTLISIDRIDDWMAFDPDGLTSKNF